MKPIHKLEIHLRNLGDICIPELGDPWILVDDDDNDLAEGVTLEQAASLLPDNDEEEPLTLPPVDNKAQSSEIERLNFVIAAQRRLLIQWTEAYQELLEQTQFIIK
jgi:hypothetical protein